MSNQSLQNTRVVITGGSSGIGYAIADNALSRGATVFLLSRSHEKLSLSTKALQQKYPDGNVYAYACNVADSEDVMRCVQQIADDHGGIDWLVNNAGTADFGRFESQPLTAMHNVMNVNHWGAVHMTLAALPHLKRSTKASLVFVSSVAGYAGLFGYTHYAPSKFAMSGLAECLRMEFKDYGIPVTIVYPPDTDTPMHALERQMTLPESRALSAAAKVISPERVAEKILNGVLKQKFEVYCNAESKLVRIWRNLFPRSFFGYVDGVVRKSRLKKG